MFSHNHSHSETVPIVKSVRQSGFVTDLHEFVQQVTICCVFVTQNVSLLYLRLKILNHHQTAPNDARRLLKDEGNLEIRKCISFIVLYENFNMS